MRIDSIDLIGNFLIKGKTASNSQAIGMSGSGVTWINVVGGAGSSAGLAQTSGQNYIIVEATSDKDTNGTNLLNALTEAETLITKIGTPSDTNRITIFLTPGIYKFSTITLGSSFIDIIGMSPNPYDTVLRATGQYTFENLTNQDFTLENVFVDGSESAGQQIITGGTSGIFLRWKNLVINNYGTGGAWSVTTYMDGIFEDIHCIGLCNFAYVSQSLMGTYKNIRIDSCGAAFHSDLDVDFINCSDIYIDTFNPGAANTRCFYAGRNFSGNFYNIYIEKAQGAVFVNDETSANTGYFTGTFKNITINTTDTILNSEGWFFYSGYQLGSAYSHFENITFNTGSQEYDYIFSTVTNGSSITGRFKNIKIYGSPNSCFSSFNPDIGTNLNGYYENIYVQSPTYLFYSSKSIGGTYKDITVDGVVTYMFKAIDGDINVKVRNLKVYQASQLFMSNENFTPFAAALTLDLDGMYSDFRVGALFQSDRTISATIRNVYLGRVDNTVFSSTSTAAIWLNNFQANQLDSDFLSVPTTQQSFSNIKIGTVANFVVVTNVSTIFFDVEVGKCNGNAFYAPSGVAGGSGFYVYNIKIGSVLTNAFFSTIGIPITFMKNVEIGSVGTRLLYGAQFQSIIHDLKVGVVGTEMIVATGLSSTIQGTGLYNVEVNQVKGDFYMCHYNNATFYTPIENGYIYNLRIDRPNVVFKTINPNNRKMNFYDFYNLNIGTANQIFNVAGGTATHMRNVNLEGISSVNFSAARIEWSNFKGQGGPAVYNNNSILEWSKVTGAVNAIAITQSLYNIVPTYSFRDDPSTRTLFQQTIGSESNVYYSQNNFRF
jgi:hypothetical protein